MSAATEVAWPRARRSKNNKRRGLTASRPSATLNCHAEKFRRAMFFARIANLGVRKSLDRLREAQHDHQRCYKKPQELN
jgi:hypothetical protein